MCEQLYLPDWWTKTCHKQPRDAVDGRVVCCPLRREEQSLYKWGHQSVDNGNPWFKSEEIWNFHLLASWQAQNNSDSCLGVVWGHSLEISCPNWEQALNRREGSFSSFQHREFLKLICRASCYPSWRSARNHGQLLWRRIDTFPSRYRSQLPGIHA